MSEFQPVAIDARTLPRTVRLSPTCDHCGEVIEHTVQLHYQGRTFRMHLHCLFDTAALAALLIPLAPAGTPV